MKRVNQYALVISASDFFSYMRCPKSFDLGWRRGWYPLVDKEAVTKGSAFHLWMEAYALMEMPAPGPSIIPRMNKINILQGADETGMQAVAEAYIEHRWKQNPPCKILMVEQPLYTKVLDKGCTDKYVVWEGPDVWIRTTFDLVYQDEDGWIVARDYKSFVNNVTFDQDLDFQSRIYTSVLQRHFGTDKVRFEFENVRQTPPNVVKDKSGGMWRPDECYINIPGYYAKHELDALWAETQGVAADIVRKLRSGDPHTWYRVGLKGHSPFTCGSCFVKDMCKAEVQQEVLDNVTASQFAQRRAYETITLPDGTQAVTEKARHEAA
jgi:PD-(D/E)XK nuclease superfamily